MPNRRKSTVLLNSREEVVSSDLNRMQQLASREWLNERKDRNRADSFVNALSGAQQLIGQGVTKPYLILEPTWDPDNASFDVDVGAGEGHQPASSGAGVDEPEVIVHRWNAATLTFDAPDPNPRIDIVICTPGENQTDPQTRTILQNPTTQVTAPATVNKTINPLGTLSIVKGTAAASDPTPPSIPAGTLGLFAVLVPAGATDATGLGAVRMVNRSTIEYLGTYHGMIEGFTYAMDGSTFSMAGGNGSRDMVRAIIDGELVQGAPPVNGGNPDAVVVDTSNDPFAVAAGAFDEPFYLYLVGGSSFLNEVIVTGAFGSSPFTAAPFIVVQSTVAPNADGHPSAAITTPWGTTQRAALFIGWGWKEESGTTRKEVRMGADGWVEARGNANNYPNITTPWRVFDEIEGGAGGSRATIPGASSFTDYPISSAPPFPDTGASWNNARRARLISAVTIPSGNGEILTWGTTDGNKMIQHPFFNLGVGSIMNHMVEWEARLSTSNPPSVRLHRGAAGAGVTSVEVFATAFWCPARRLSSF